MADEPILLTDDPAPHVRRITLNRPAKRNALSNALRGAIFAALEAGDADPEVRVMILRGAGTCFSSGYDLAGTGALPYHVGPARGGGLFPGLGPGQAGDRPGARLVPRRRLGARGRL